MSQTTVDIQIKVEHENISEYHYILSLIAKAIEAEGAEVVRMGEAKATWKPCGHSGNCRCMHGGGSIATRSTD